MLLLLFLMLLPLLFLLVLPRLLSLPQTPRCAAAENVRPLIEPSRFAAAGRPRRMRRVSLNLARRNVSQLGT